MARQSFVVQHSKGNGTPWIRDALLRRGWREVPGGGDAAHVRRCLSQSNGLGFCWLRGHDPLVSNYPMEMHATSNRWPNRATSPESLGLGCLWRKDGLLATLDAYYSCQGLDPWQHHPLSFVLPDGATDGSPQWEAFRHVFDAVAEGCEPRVPAEQSRRNLWLLKPGNGSCARGICVGDSVEVLQQHYQRSTQGSGQSLQTADDAAQAAAISRPREHWVVQKYVEAPMLYRGRKFDLRLFAVIESDRESALGFSVYVHREGYGRTSSETYSIAPNALHNSMHLTNYSIQKGARSYGRHERGNCVSFADLEASLGKASGFRDTLVPAMHALVADAVLAARSELLDTLRTACTPHAKYRSLIAFDMIVDAEGRPSILEINPSAGMEPQSEWHGKFFRRLLDDYVSLSVDVQIGRRQPFDSGRPLLDGTHVRQYPDDGWLLLLGAPGARPTPAEFDVRECAGRLVLARPGGMGGAPEADADEQLEQPTGHKPLSPDDGC